MGTVGSHHRVRLSRLMRLYVGNNWNIRRYSRAAPYARVAVIMENVVIGIDLSTTTAKAIAWDRDGRLMAQGRAPLSLERPEPNAYEQHPDNWWRAVQSALSGVLTQVPAKAVAAVAIANQRETVAV